MDRPGFTPQRGADASFQSGRRGVGGEALPERRAQRAHPLLEAAAIVAAAQVLFDFAPVRDV